MCEIGWEDLWDKFGVTVFYAFGRVVVVLKFYVPVQVVDGYGTPVVVEVVVVFTIVLDVLIVLLLKYGFLYKTVSLLPSTPIPNNTPRTSPAIANKPNNAQHIYGKLDPL
jgi:hypothetical protein